MIRDESSGVLEKLLSALALSLALITFAPSPAAANAPGVIEERLPNGCTRITVPDRPVQGAKEVTLYCPDSHGYLQRVPKPGDFVAAWIGRLPTDDIDGHNLLGLFRKNFLVAVSKAEADSGDDFAPGRTVNVIYGRVGALSTSGCADLSKFCDVGGTYIFFPYCLVGECADPNAGAQRIAVTYYNRNAFTDGTTYLVVSAVRGSGSRLCLQDSVYASSAPRCLDRAEALPRVGGEQIGRVAANIYRVAADWMANSIDAAMEYNRIHYKNCHIATAELTVGGFVVDTRSRTVCDFVP